MTFDARQGMENSGCGKKNQPIGGGQKVHYGLRLPGYDYLPV